MPDHIPLVESAELLSFQALPGNYTRLLLRAPQSVAVLRPGQYLSGRISRDGPSACLPVMGVNADILECLYRNHAETRFPEILQDHGRLIVTLQGKGWNLDDHAPHIVFLAQNEGLACVVHAANRLRLDNSQKALTALLEFDDNPPFTPKPSQILLPGIPAEALACVPLLEDWGIASRLADPGDHRTPKPGWFSGTASMLAAIWFEKTAGENCLLACCGTRSFVNAISKLADHCRLPLESSVLPGSPRAKINRE